MYGKKTLYFLVVLIISSLILTSCKETNTPENLVNDYFDGMRKFDYEKMYSLVNPELELEYEQPERDKEDKLLNFVKENAKKIEMEILDTQIEGDNATVKVKTKYVDGSELMKKTLVEVISESLISAGREEELSEAKMEELKDEIIKKNIDEFQETFVEEELSINCIKIDGKWYLENLDTALENVMTSNMYNMLEDMTNALGDVE